MVETFHRKENGVWEIARYIGIDAVINLKSIGIEIKLRDLYLNVGIK